MRERCSDVRNLGYLKEKLGKFKYFAPDFERFFSQRRIREKLRIEVSNHRGARAGWTNNNFRRAEDADKSLRKRLRIVPVTAIEGGLATTRLRLWKIDIVAKPPQHTHHVQTNLGQQLVDKTGNE